MPALPLSAANHTNKCVLAVTENHEGYVHRPGTQNMQQVLCMQQVCRSCDNGLYGAIRLHAMFIRRWAGLHEAGAVVTRGPIQHGQASACSWRAGADVA